MPSSILHQPISQSQQCLDGLGVQNHGEAGKDLSEQLI